MSSSVKINMYENLWWFISKIHLYLLLVMVHIVRVQDELNGWIMHERTTRQCVLPGICSEQTLNRQSRGWSRHDLLHKTYITGLLEDAGRGEIASSGSGDNNGVISIVYAYQCRRLYIVDWIHYRNYPHGLCFVVFCWGLIAVTINYILQSILWEFCKKNCNVMMALHCIWHDVLGLYSFSMFSPRYPAFLCWSWIRVSPYLAPYIPACCAGVGSTFAIFSPIYLNLLCLVCLDSSI